MREEAIKAKLEAMLPPRIDHIVPFNGIHVHVPLRYTDARAFMVFMRADVHRVKAMIGCDRMTPVRLPGKKCVLGLTVFDFGTCDVGPYRELALSIPVLLDSRFNLPLVPLLFERMFPLLGFLTLQLAMTTDIARAHNDRFFGYPTHGHSIRIDIEGDDNNSRVSAYEGDCLITELSLQHRLRFRFKNKTYRTFFIKRDRIHQALLDAATYESEAGEKYDCRVSLGDHPIANLARGLVVGNQPLRSVYYRNVVEVLRHPQDLGST